MKKSETAEAMARRRGLETVKAADQLDSAVNRILRTLKSGRPARLPGIGTIQPGKPWTFKPDSHER